MEKSNHSSSDKPLFAISTDLIKGTDVNAKLSESGVAPVQDIEEKYLVQETIGQGGMGKICKVDDKNLNRTLAMKILAPKNIKDASIGEAFIEEARITAQLQHPNIIPIHDIGVLPDSGNHFYTMKLVEGESLQEIIDALIEQKPEYLKKYTMHALLTIFRKVCDPLAYAHSKNVIHRDIKPGNIMVGQFGEVLLLDWGLAKYKDADVADRSQQLQKTELSSGHLNDALMTMDGTIKGSLAYLSPEQALADVKDIDHQTDIFLLGATLYHMLTLQPPYSGKSVLEIITKAEEGKFTHPNDTANGARIPEALANIIVKSMAPDKKRRFKSVNEMIRKLDDYLEGRNVSEMRYYNKGETLIKDEDLGDDTFILVDGEVEVIHNIDGKLTVLDTLGKGAVFGELAPLTHDLRSATIRATKNSCVMVISKQLMFDEIRKLPPWLEKVLFTLASKVCSMNDRIHPFILSNCSLPVLKQLLYLFSMSNTNEENQKTVAIERYSLIHEISQNLGLSSARISEVLLILQESGLAEGDHMDRVCITSLQKLTMLIAYIKREENITEGISQSLGEIDIEQIPILDEIYQRMTGLQY